MHSVIGHTVLSWCSRAQHNWGRSAGGPSDLKSICYMSSVTVSNLCRYLSVVVVVVTVLHCFSCCLSAIVQPELCINNKKITQQQQQQQQTD